MQGVRYAVRGRRVSVCAHQRSNVLTMCTNARCTMGCVATFVSAVCTLHVVACTTSKSLLQAAGC